MQQKYSAQNIQVLKGLDAVRKRPGMYIGTTGPDGLHHLVYEVVDNSIDEALGGFCTEIVVTVEKGNVVTVVDDGRGIPTDIHPAENVSALEIVMTKLHAGGKFDKNSYKVSGGLHGVGVSVVNALSEWLVATVYRDGSVFQQKYQRGIPTGDVQVTGTSDKTGTVVSFLPDSTIFETVEFSFDVLSRRLRELAFLNKGIKIRLVDKRLPTEKSHEFKFEGGVKEFVDYLNKNKNTIHREPIYLEGSGDGVLMEIAMEYNDGYIETIFTFANNINTREGGTHLVGFKSAITRTLNDFLRKSKLGPTPVPRLAMIG